MAYKKKGYLGNPNLKPEGQSVSFTKKQVEEYIKCSNDPIYFIEKYIKVVSLDKGLVPFNMYGYQKEIVTKVHNNRFVIAKLPRQSGKCVYSDTKVILKNKKTGEIKEISIENLYKSIKSQDN